MKTVMILFVLFPCLSSAQIQKITVGGILIESFDQKLNWSQDFRLTLNLNLKETNHHLIFKKNTIQTSNALELKFCEPYLFISYNTKEKDKYLELGIQKGIPTSFGSVVFFSGIGTSFPFQQISFSWGVAIHPQFLIFKSQNNEK